MSTAFLMGSFGPQCGTLGVTATRGISQSNIGGRFSRGKLASDALFNVTLRMLNGATGSAYRIEVASTGALVASGTISASPEDVSVPYYGGGGADTLKVKVRKASAAPKYQPFETQAVLNASGATAYLAQVADNIA